MKRSKTDKKKKAKGEVTFKKVGGGSFFLNRKTIIKPGQTFHARPEDIPEAFKDVVIQVFPGEAKVAKEKKVAPKKKSEYSLKHVSGGWYDVFDADKKQVNEKRLKKVDAEELIETLG